MSKLALLFFKRTPKLFLKIGLLSLFLFLLISSYGIGYAIFEKSSLTKTIGDIERDFEIEGEIKQNYTANNISLLFPYQNYWLEFKKEWTKFIISDNLILLINLAIDNYTLQIGLDLSESTENARTETIVDNSFNFFNSIIDISSFILLDELPFNLDILINYKLLNNSFSEEFKIGPNNCNLGYSVNLDEKLFSSLISYLKTVDKMDEAFESFIAQTNLVYTNNLDSRRIETELSFSFAESFQFLLIVFTFVSILLSTWLIEFFLSFYNKQIAKTLKNLEKRGLNTKNKTRITVFLPIIVDTTSLAILGLSFVVVDQVLSLNLIPAFIFALIGYLYLFYKRFKFNSLNEELSTRMNTISVSIYIIVLIISALIPIIVNNFISALVPPLISSIISIGSSIVFYYIITIILSEIAYSVKRSRTKNKITDSISRLIEKTIISTKSNLKSWHSLTLLLVWAIVITNIGSNTFIAEYELYQETDYPTDLIIEIEEGYLANVSKLESVLGIEFIFPVSHSTQKYLIDYDYYLMNFTKIEQKFPELIKRTKLNSIQTNHTYISESFAEELGFENENLFPTSFGENQTNIIVNQPVIVTKYFPLVKEIDNRPFIVANYREAYSEFSEVTKLLVDFDVTLISTEQVVEKIRESTGSSVSIQNENEELDYNSILNTYKYLFFVIASFICLLGFIHFINKFSTVFNQMNLRGLEMGKIRALLIKEISYFILSAFSFGILSALFFLFVQLSDCIYKIPLFTPISIEFRPDLFLLFVIPLIIAIVIFSSRFKKNTHKTSY
jgi:hypothetical protein